MDRYSYESYTIIISDRGFAIYNVFAYSLENIIDFVIRAKDVNIQRILHMAAFPDSLDITVEIFLTRTRSKKKYLHPELTE